MHVHTYLPAADALGDAIGPEDVEARGRADPQIRAQICKGGRAKGFWGGREMSWLIEDMCNQLKAWSHAGGIGGELLMKSDGEPVMLVARDAVLKYHGEG